MDRDILPTRAAPNPAQLSGLMPTISAVHQQRSIERAHLQGLAGITDPCLVNVGNGVQLVDPGHPFTPAGLVFLQQSVEDAVAQPKSKLVLDDDASPEALATAAMIVRVLAPVPRAEAQAALAATQLAVRAKTVAEKARRAAIEALADDRLLYGDKLPQDAPAAKRERRDKLIETVIEKTTLLQAAEERLAAAGTIRGAPSLMTFLIAMLSPSERADVDIIVTQAYNGCPLFHELVSVRRFLGFASPSLCKKVGLPTPKEVVAVQKLAINTRCERNRAFDGFEERDRRKDNLVEAKQAIVALEALAATHEPAADATDADRAAQMAAFWRDVQLELRKYDWQDVPVPSPPSSSASEMPPDPKRARVM